MRMTLVVFGLMLLALLSAVWFVHSFFQMIEALVKKSDYIYKLTKQRTLLIFVLAFIVNAVFICIVIANADKL